VSQVQILSPRPLNLLEFFLSQFATVPETVPVRSRENRRMLRLKRQRAIRDAQSDPTKSCECASRRTRPAALASGPLAQLLAPSAWIVSITEANTSVFIFLPSFAVRDTAHVVASIATNLTTTNENRARSKTTAVGVAPTPLTASQSGSTVGEDTPLARQTSSFLFRFLVEYPTHKIPPRVTMIIRLDAFPR
jgi:hypothetical protein